MENDGSGEASPLYTAWQIPRMRRVVKQEFMAAVNRSGLSAPGLLEEILVEWLFAQGVEIDDDSIVEPPVQCRFRRRRSA